jgi:hypothetical protein
MTRTGYIEGGSISPALLAAQLGCINLAHQGDGCQKFLASSNTLRRQLATYCSHMHLEYAVNDFTNLRTTANVLADNLSIRNLIGMPCTIQTIEPNSSGAGSAQNNSINAYNDAVRGGISDVIGYFEVADVVTTARNSSTWISGYTADNLHETASGYAAVAAAIDTSKYVR